MRVVLGCGRFGFNQEQSRDNDARPSDAAGSSVATSTDAGSTDAALDPSLVAWWRMTALVVTGVETQQRSTSRRASRGPRPDVAPTSAPCPTVVAGGHDGLDACEFDGSTTMLAAGSATALIDSKFTIAAWVYNDAANGGCYMTKGLGSGVFNSWALCNNSTKHQLFFYTVQGSNADSLQPGNIVPNGSWHHVAGTWDGTSKVLYLDGNKLGDYQPMGIDFDTDPVYIGGDVDNGAAVSFLPGMLDDVRVYNRSLNGNEVSQLAKQ